jgi:U3 small nucleolar RNA-associated protein 25
VAESEDASSDEDDAVESPAVRPYAALLQSLAVDSAPQAKRRRLESALQQDQREHETEGTSVPEQGQDIDRVEEDEEEPETAVEGLLEDDENAVEDASDPYQARFANPEDNFLSRRLKALQKKNWIFRKSALPKVGKAIIGTPGDSEAGEPALPAAISGPSGLKLKQKLASSFSKHASIFNPLEQSIAPFLFSYHDVLFCERHAAQADSLRRLTCLHAVNHVFK